MQTFDLDIKAAFVINADTLGLFNICSKLTLFLLLDCMESLHDGLVVRIFRERMQIGQFGKEVP